ncbi:MAG: hypothetical protein IKT50_00595 [Clostridia bacterium]|nr:hypothetical protein [Clostridia bacterium]
MKSIGLIFLSLVPMAIGFFKGEELGRAGKIKKALIDFFQTARTQVALYRREQKDIFFDYEDKNLEKAGFLPLLREEIQKDPCLALKRAMDSSLNTLNLSAIESKALTEFSENFGMQSHASQLTDFDKVLSVLNEEYERFEKDLQGKIKLNRTIGITAGLGIYILLI